MSRGEQVMHIEGGPLRLLENAVVRLLKRAPFYGHFLLGFHRRVEHAEYALGVTIAGGIPTLCIAPERFALLEADQQEALLEHVLKHVLHLHPVRGKGKPASQWDLACDLAINPTIENLPPRAAYPHRLKMPEGLAAEEYYPRIPPSWAVGNQKGQGIGSGSLDEDDRFRQEAQSAPDTEEPTGSESGEILDNHQVWSEAESTPDALAREVIRSMVQEAVKKSDGHLPFDIRPLVDDILAFGDIPWRQVLRQFVATSGRVGRKSSWTREHRRFSHATPGQRKRHRLNLLVGVDVSESTDELPLREAFARELLSIARGRESQITVLYAGSRIQRIDTLSHSTGVVEVFRGGGFTDLRPVFDYARQMQPAPAAVIYLTDGLGPAPEKVPLPTLWVLTKDGQKPVDWGVELRLTE